MSLPYKYFAFISYSRKDSRVAAWLQRRLEWFRFPVKLVAVERRPPHERYVRPIYRDKTNLEVTDEHYWMNIRRALEESRYLVVLCSPHAAGSEPVNMEVAHFLESHGGDASLLVPVIVSGNVMSADADAALCPALRALGGTLTDRNLPTMVSDATTEEQGAWEDGFVSLIAYLLRLERGAVGDHIQRETKRQAAVLRRWLVAVGVLALAAIGAGVVAWLKQQEAVRQKIMAQESEARALHNLGLAHTMRDRSQELNLFFIGDLRTKLRALGRLDLLEEATRRVVEYHEQIPPELAHEPGMLRARAMAMDYSGQIAHNQGDAALAVQRLEASHAAWSQMIAANAGDVESVEGFAINCRMLGEALQSAGKLQEALKQYEQGCEALEGLHAKNEAGEAQLNRLQSTLRVVQGKARFRLGDHAAALRDLDAAADLARKATEARPKDRANWEKVVEAFDELALHYLRIDDHPAALKQAKAAVEAAEVLIKLDIENANGWYIAAGSYGSLLMAQAAAKDWPAAVEAAETQLMWRKRYFQRDTLNPAAEVLLARAHDDLGFALTYTREGERAVEEFSEAVKILAGLIQRHPSRNDWRRDLGLVFKRRADLFYEAEGWELALRDYDNSLRMCRLLAKAAPEDVDAHTRLANTLTAKGETQSKMGDLDGAQQTYEEGLGALKEMPQDHPEVAARLKGLKAAMAALNAARSTAPAPVTPKTGMPTGR
ncbi:MAG: toll/interleukin-1 receptor domain-containing protein [Verrucomicrobia bacterium]|nr:toll/interleukin-1 receptor domain-containing protein [Verrucomicrobiota bacterium]